ncbi:FkbM family methyltransferase [Nostoc sp. UIC 10890]
MENNTLNCFYEYKINEVSFKLFDPDSSVPKETTKDLDYEPSVINLLSRILTEEPSDFMDVGAHYGYYTCYVGKLNPQTKIYSFEPGPNHFEILSKNVAENQVNAEIFDLALSDKSGDISFQDRTMKVDITKNIPPVTVKAITFDELSSQKNIHPAVVKIDVHGAEGKVLFGMEETLRNSIKHLFIEIHAAHLVVEYSYEQIITLLAQTGFYIYEMLGFRDTEKPDMVPIEKGEPAYQALIDQSLWTKDQINRERMIYACKESKYIDVIDAI